MKRPLVLFFLILLLATIGFLASYYFFIFRPAREDELFIERSTIKKFLHCPVPQEYCSRGKIVEVDGSYLGIGYQVPENTPILAVFAGQVKNSRMNYINMTSGGQFPSLILTDFNSGFSVNYVLTGRDEQRLVNVWAEEEILKTQSGEIADFGVNLIVSVFDAEKEIIKLEPKDFLAN